MKRAQIVKEIEEIIDVVLPGANIDVLSDRGQPDLLIGTLAVYASFSIDGDEWREINPEAKVTLVKERIKELLYEMQNKINKDIEGIENHGAT